MRVNLTARGLLDRRFLLLGCTALAGALAGLPPALAEDGLDGKTAHDSSVHALPVGANTEAEGAADAPSIPFKISVDGETVDESAEPTADSALAPGEARPEPVE
ncbi:hypothetical protein, partial [Chelativorans sp. M5D2P16]|uniref:hypothetical protein n=1 Tax=Chelativorans sp. M5D2P16 TaxID=3095678 RepID=UPI002ACAE510